MIYCSVFDEQHGKLSAPDPCAVTLSLGQSHLTTRSLDGPTDRWTPSKAQKGGGLCLNVTHRTAQEHRVKVRPGTRTCVWEKHPAKGGTLNLERRFHSEASRWCRHGLQL
jgi:hypothetical protein